MPPRTFTGMFQQVVRGEEPGSVYNKRAQCSNQTRVRSSVCVIITRRRPVHNQNMREHEIILNRRQKKYGIDGELLLCGKKVETAQQRTTNERVQ